MIEGSFTGKTGPGTSPDYVIGSNVPGSRMNNAGWAMLTGSGVNKFSFGVDAPGGGGGWDSNSGPLTPPEAWNIDLKLDDGKPMTGKVVRGDTSCSVNSNPDTDYRFNVSNLTCPLGFIPGF